MSKSNNSELLNPLDMNKIGKLKWISIILTCFLVFTFSSTIKPVRAETESETKWVLDRVIVGEGSEVVVPDGDRFEGSFDKYTVSSTSITHHSRAFDHWKTEDFVDALFEFSLPVFPAELVPGQTVEVSASGSGSGYMRAGYFVRTLEFRSDDVGLTGKLSPYAVVEWVYRCEENVEEVPEEDSEEIPEITDPTFKVEPERGNPGDEITCIGTDYPENADVTIYWESSSGESWETTSDNNGAFRKNIIIPNSAKKGIHDIIAEAETISLSDQVEVVFKPIIFIPGVGGSQLYDGAIQLWPAAPLAGRKYLVLDEEGKSNVMITAPDIIRYVLGLRASKLDVYGSFVETVISWGYEEDKDFFVFPYDWRLDNYKHIEALDQKIDEAIRSSGQKNVVLVAHSMGGIVARAYMDEKSTDKIDSFITMGTPHRGAVKPYYAFLSGYNFGNSLAGNKMMKVIIQNCEAAYQIMPWKPFIWGPSGAVTPNGAPVLEEWSLEKAYGVWYHSTYLEPRTELFYLDANDWEWNLNPVMVDETKAFRNRLGTEAPTGIETYTIIGQGKATLSSYTAREPTSWESFRSHGINSEGHRWVLEPNLRQDFRDGDGTVPIWSSSGLLHDMKFYFQDLPGFSAEHGSLPANLRVQQLLKHIITGVEVDVNDYPRHDYYDLEGEKGFEIHSSANLHIYDSEGNHMGVNEYGSIEEGIPGGSMIAMDGYEYCSILNPQDSYDVEVVGFEEGNFSLNVVIRSDGETVEFSYPEIDVVNGSIASFTLPDSQSAKDDPPEMTVQTEDTVLTFLPEVIEEQKLVEDTTTRTEDTDNDSNSGIPGFPILSILLATLLVSYLLNKKRQVMQF